MYERDFRCASVAWPLCLRSQASARPARYSARTKRPGQALPTRAVGPRTRMPDRAARRRRHALFPQSPRSPRLASARSQPRGPHTGPAARRAALRRPTDHSARAQQLRRRALLRAKARRQRALLAKTIAAGATTTGAGSGSLASSVCSGSSAGGAANASTTQTRSRRRKRATRAFTSRRRAPADLDGRRKPLRPADAEG